MPHARTLSFSPVRLSALAALWTWLLLQLGGCAALVDTPDYQRPDLPAKQDWSAALDATRRIDLKWWQAFADPALDTLMEQAIAANPNLAVLAARTGVARSQISQAQARLLPVLNVGGRTDTTSISGATDLGTSNKLGVGGDLTWELDIWGKARKGVAAQKAAFAATEADWRAGYLVMAAAVSNAYFQIRQSDAQLDRQHAAIARAEEILDLLQRMHQRGLIAETRLLQQDAELARLRAGVLELQRVRALTVNALATLTGQVAGEFALPSTQDLPPIEPVQVPTGLPAQMLNRRPDLVAAEYRLLQSVQLEGQSRLAQLPTIGLTALGGSASYGLSDLLKTWTGSLSSVVQFPVFNPNVRAQIKASQAQVQVAEAEYRVAVFKAFEEVENTLVNLANRNAQARQLQSRLDKLNQVRKRTLAQLELGLVSRLEVLERERSLLDADQAVLANRWQRLNDSVSLFKALGGGWDPQTVGAD
ncbi:MAG: efflux transporter outer membrane subunit [Pseudomonadales bacterium]